MNTYTPANYGFRNGPRWAIFALLAVLLALVFSGCAGGFGSAPVSMTPQDFENIGKEMVAIEQSKPDFSFERFAPRQDEHGNIVKDQSGHEIFESVTQKDPLAEQALKDQIEKVEGQENSSEKTLELARLNYILGYLTEFQKTERNTANSTVVYGDAKDYYTKAGSYNTGYTTIAIYRLAVLGANGLLGPQSESLNEAKTDYQRLRYSYDTRIWVRNPEVAGKGGAVMLATGNTPAATRPTLIADDAAAVATRQLDAIYRKNGGRDATYYYAIDAFIKFFNRLSPAYGVVIALFVLALLVKLITAPLTAISMRGMRDMQRIQPLLKELQEKYKEDRAKQAEEQMRIMREHNVKPMAGCLPMLIQLPIFLVVYSAVQLYLYQFTRSHFFWIHSLARPDWPLLILYAISLVITQKLTTTPSADPQQQAIQNQMTYLMPVIMFMVLKNIASAFVLYWFFLNVLSSIHQYYLMRQFRRERRPPGWPRTAAPVAREEEREATMSEMTPLSEDALIAQEVMQAILREMAFPAEVTVSETPEQIQLTLSSEQPMGLLIGRNGQTLNAIELLVKTIAQHKLHMFHRHLLVDAEGYRQHQTDRLEETARQAANEVLDTGESVSLEAMNARDRRTVHMTIAEIEGVSSFSVGEEPYRHLVICLPGQEEKEDTRRGKRGRRMTVIVQLPLPTPASIPHSRTKIA